MFGTDHVFPIVSDVRETSDTDIIIPDSRVRDDRDTVSVCQMILAYFFARNVLPDFYGGARPYTD